MPKLFALVLTLLLALSGNLPSPARAQMESTPVEIAERARFSLDKMIRSQDLRPVPELLARARGVMIFPQLIKGAFFFGGEGGSGVLLARGQNGGWSYPAFYTLGAFSFGLQIGAEATEAVLLIMTDRGLKAILDDQVKLGVDVSAAAGPVGIGVGAATSTAFNADIYTYSTKQGLFIGGALEGAVVARRDDWNQEAYGRAVAPPEIIYQNSVRNPGMEPLRQSLSRF